MKNGIGKQVNKVIKLLEAHVEWLSVDEEKEADAKAIYDDAYEAVLLEFSELQSRLESLEKDAARFKKLAAHMTFALDGEFVTMDFSCPVDATKTHDIHEDWIEPNFTDSVRNTVDTAMQANKGE